jgi:hypothetical protein
VAPQLPVYQPAAPLPVGGQSYIPPAAAASIAKAEASGAFFFYPVLKALNDGRIIRRGVIIFLQLLAVLSVLGGLFLTFTSLSGNATLGTILGAVVMLAGILCVAQVFWYRATSISALSHDEADEFGSKFTVIPIASLLFRLIGEVAATMMVAVGLSMFLTLLLASSSTGGMAMPIPIPGMPPMPGGVAGAFIALVVFFALGFVELVVFYLLAESTVVMVDVAEHIRKLVKQGETRK